MVVSPKPGEVCQRPSCVRARHEAARKVRRLERRADLVRKKMEQALARRLPPVITIQRKEFKITSRALAVKLKALQDENMVLKDREAQAKSVLEHNAALRGAILSGTADGMRRQLDALADLFTALQPAAGEKRR